MHKKAIFFIDFVYTYPPFYHTYTCEISKDSIKDKIAIAIQSSISHIHWPIFENEKKERLEIGVLISI